MLIIGREVGQSVIIGDVIKVTVLQFDSKLHLRIDAPEHIRVSYMKPCEVSMKKFKKRTKIIGETMLIGEVIKITILQTESGLLRIAIDAPKEVSIFREELCKSSNRTVNQKVQIS